mmetsp:Transcript_1642/g.2357  ORF Transcript_1642/g.2357 Transcript_1642/m.2357 type:complete len:202 (+) Transcript_1642:126-731(+)|eukprot:CAMPEP_0198142570 /NCGR_PEP_ID=MMETSP1443-20131203/5325_1 /TAXON_ID=186043 /ORGANISM="Entomoneis sp., Strain CCMP2396" /LENGTH=201 /DNA_ID=CAMNT_0043805615 /DNA_START=128 /DNA_END=733 /DNA_ORIENTATION=+
MVLSATKIIDGRGHLLGRLCSIVAKELLAGQTVVIVRCDEVCVSGSLTRNKVKYAQFRAKKMNTNPGRGPFHHRSPSMIVWRTIRGMVPHMTPRGQAALKRLSTFEGIPAPFDKKERVVIPAALKVMRLKAGRDFTVVGDLAHAVGWKHRELLQRLEGKRKAESKDWFEKKKANMDKRKQAEKAAAGELEKVNKVLAEAGY